MHVIDLENLCHFKMLSPGDGVELVVEVRTSAWYIARFDHVVPFNVAADRPTNPCCAP